MTSLFQNPQILSRFKEVIEEGEKQWRDFQQPGLIKDPVRFTKWTTSCLNLLDKLSVTTNRFVIEFEEWAKLGKTGTINLGATLGVLKATQEEYEKGLAVDYQLSGSAAVFGDLLDQAEYLLSKGYGQAAAVLMGGALEQALKSRARSLSIDVDQKTTLTPLITRLKADPFRVFTEFEAKRLEAIARMRNDAAHGNTFCYTIEEIRSAHMEIAILWKKFLAAESILLRSSLELCYKLTPRLIHLCCAQNDIWRERVAAEILLLLQAVGDYPVANSLPCGSVNREAVVSRSGDGRDLAALHSVRRSETASMKSWSSAACGLAATASD